MDLAMRLGQPDRVPFMCQLAMGHYFLHAGLAPVDIWTSSESFANALVTMQRRYAFDGILVNLPGRDPGWESHLDRVAPEPSAGVTRLHWKNGGTTLVPRDDNPCYRGPDGRRGFPTFESVDPEQLWYVEPWDVTGVNHPYTWSFDSEARPDDDFFPPYHLDTLRAVRERVGAEVSVHAELFSPFAQLLELLDVQHGLLALMDDPGKAHACLERLTAGAIDLGCRQAGADIDALLISSPYAGAGMISRGMYEQFVLPYERRLIEGLEHEHAGLPVYTHTCGAIGDRLDLMLETGTSGVDTLDPPPLGTVELEEAVSQLEGRAFIKGNIDAVNTLLRGDEAAVEAAVDRRLEVAAPGGGYVLSTACSVAPAVEPRLIEYMGELVHTRGKYE